MSYLRLLTAFLTAITQLPGLLRWIGKLFDKSLSEQLKEVEEAEKALQGAKDEASRDSALKRVKDSVTRYLH